MSITRHQAVGAYRPWEPPAFDAAAEPAPSSADSSSVTPEGPAAAPPPPLEALPAVHLPTVAEVEQIHDQAHQEGYAAGYEEGTARGRLEALRLATLVENLEGALAQVDAEVAEELLALSIEIARLMVRRELAHKPEGIVDVVREALAQLPQSHALIHLHPEDTSLVREYLGEQLSHSGNRIVEDERVTPGGCRIEASGSQIDATLQTRWRRILQNLGCGEANWDVGPEE
jgi:flagellar assembly protein FliH